ncbi:MAG: hypothetical protein AB7F96_06650 [Beijerinckiaceae bacterium]
MRAANPKILFLTIAICLALTGCFWDQRSRDMDTIRRQLHLPDDIAFAAFDHAPKSFRPEGLRIEATMRFTDAQFARYRAQLDDASVWKPVALESYSPAIGERYSQSALRWKPLPAPQFPGKWRKHWEMIDIRPEAIREGRYFCSIIRYVRGAPFKSTPVSYRAIPIGEACEEIPSGESPIVVMLGILDDDAKLLHVRMAFSG